MACYGPLKGWLSKNVTANGKRTIVFNHSEAITDMPKSIPCGQCIGCRLERSRQWAIRCNHEASLYDDNCFITLTYDDDNLPADRSLDVRTFQLFMKRLRKKYDDKKIRFYACGEYGEKYGRPHYHACLFNHDFADKTVWKAGRDANTTLYRSKELEQLWTYGYSSIGRVTFQSAAYVARYIMKKITGPKAGDHYSFINERGVVIPRLPEFTVMSRRPGVGKRWLEKYATDVYPDDFVVLNGKRMRPPRFYDTEFEKTFPSDHKKVVVKRKQRALKHAENNTTARLRVREHIQTVKANRLLRNHDKDDLS